MEERFTIVNRGMKIAAIRHIHPDRPRPTVILLHGFTGSKNESHDLFVKAAESIHSSGMNAVRFDFRYGKTEANGSESDGEIRDMTIGEWVSDARRIRMHVAGMPEVDEGRIALLGLSMGGLTAICEAAADDGVAAVVAWSAPADLARRLRDPDRRRSIQSVAPGRFEALVRSASRHVPVRAIGRIAPRPILIVAGTEDRTVPAEEAEELFEFARDPRTLILLGGANHTFTEHQVHVISATISWLKSTGIPPRPTAMPTG
jgi:dienelactone hydrolase